MNEENLLSTFRYEPETGLLYRMKSPKKRFEGKVVGAKESRGYLQVRFEGRLYMAHRIIWFIVYGHWPQEEIDHINRDRADNRLSNLRLATRQENTWNASLRKDNRFGAKGVSDRYGRYVAIIRVNGANTNLGYFNTVAEAAEAYKSAAKQLRGEFSGI